MLVRRETSMPSWSAKIDGHSASVHKVDRIFHGVAVPAGDHSVTFSFMPPGETFGLIAFEVGIVCLIAAASG